jgi:hypothetical protein
MITRSDTPLKDSGMKNIKWPLVLIILNLVVVCWAMIRFMTLKYPIVGRDYSQFLPWILDSYLHFRINGLSIQWYTPSFGGGQPAYPNPQNVQFSIWTALTALIQPFQAVVISAIISIVMGGIATYYLLRRVFNLHWTSSILGMVFLAANGFMMQRLAVGHITFHAFPMITFLLVLLLDPSIPKAIACLIFSLVVALLVQQGSFFLIVIFGLSFLIVLPLTYIYRPAVVSLKRIFFILTFGGGITLLISLSKFSAVYSFMRFFPRQIADRYETTIFNSILGVFMQLLGTMNLVPIFKLIGANPSLLPEYIIDFSMAKEYGWWEFDMSLSPVVFGILIVGVFGLIRNAKIKVKASLSERKWIAWILLIAFTWLTIEFTLSKGLIYPLLQRLPILSSLHVNPRFAAAFMLPLVICAAFIYDGWITQWTNKKTISVFILLNILTLIPMSAFFILKRDLQDRNYNVSLSEMVYSTIRSGDPLTITGIVDNEDEMVALQLHESNLRPYEPVFGYDLENLHLEIHVGSIWDISDGYFNMTNPSSYVFPAINDTRAFERIPVSEREKLLVFASHRQADWKIPLYQKIADWVSGVSIGIVVALLATWGVGNLISILRSNKRKIENRNDDHTSDTFHA